MTSLHGACHCGNLELSLAAPCPPGELPLHACQCSFCTRHGARTTRDPRSRVAITVHLPDALVRYRFALRTADFLVCGRCGVYVAAVLTVGAESWATVNVNVLDAVDRFTQPALPVRFEGESAEERVHRRRTTWTPATVPTGARRG